MVHLVLEIFGRRREASRIRRSIELEGAKVFDSMAIHFVHVSHDAEFRRFEFEGAQWQGR